MLCPQGLDTLSGDPEDLPVEKHQRRMPLPMPENVPATLAHLGFPSSMGQLLTSAGTPKWECESHWRKGHDNMTRISANSNRAHAQTPQYTANR